MRAKFSDKRDVSTRRFSGRVQNRHELAVIISWRRRIVNAEKIYTLAVWSLKGDHDAEEIRICFQVRRTQSGGDSANAVVPHTRLKKPDTVQSFGQIVRNLQNNSAPSDLVLVRHAVEKFEIRIIGQKFPLDIGDFSHIFANRFQVRCSGTKRAPQTFVTRLFQNVFRYSISARLSLSGRSVPK